MKPTLRSVLVAALPLAFAVPSASAQAHPELGRMWTFENAPLDWFEEAYGYRPSPEWLDNLRLAALRFGNGCSASFISPNGLIITNNHCAQESVGQVSPPDQDWIFEGFFADGLEQEVPVPGLTVQQLMATEDITDRMNEGVGADTDPAERQKVMSANRKAILDAAKATDDGLQHEIVTLYQGGMYQLYSYRVYRDIRLVCAPQVEIAEFGGDPDNFTFPRFCLDFALLRAWDGDKPADTSPHYLRYRIEGPQEGDTVFVAGNPGSTGRLNTIAQMEFMRDVQYPNALAGIDGQLGNLRKSIEDDPSTEKDLRPRRLQLENARKAFGGYLAGLQNEDVMALKQEAETRLREAVAANDSLKERFGGIWERLEAIAAEKTRRAQSNQRPSRELAQEEQAILQRIGQAFFAVYGTNVPPDATFTLRLSDGVVKGYPYNGTVAPWFSSLYGLYARWTEFSGKKPFSLPQLWTERMDKLDLKTPFNFVTTCDIIGGNSGSPLVDTEGRFVGLIFDGNIESLGNRFVYTDGTARSVCVHPGIISAALRTVYDRPELANELEGKAK